MAITQVLRGDSKGAVKAVQDLNKAVNQTEKEYEGSTKSAKALEKQARRVTEQADPQKRYNRQVQELADLVRKGKVELKDAETVAQKYGQRLDRAGDSGKRAFGASAVSQITAMAGGIISLTSVVGGLTKAFGDMEQAAQAAAERSFSAIGSIGEIQQYDPERQPAILAYARRLQREGVFGPDQLAEAVDLSKSLESQGYTDAEREVVIDVGRQGTVRAENLLPFFAALKKSQTNLFSGESLESVKNRVFIASKTAATDASKIATALPTFAGSAQRLGLDPNEVTAGFIAVEAGAKNVEEATTQYKGLLSRLEKGDLVVNNDITDTIQAIEKRVARGEKLTDIIPDLEGRAGFSSLTRFSEIIAPLETKLAAGQPPKAALADVDPQFRAAQLKKRSEGRLAFAEEKAFGEQENLLDTISNNRQTWSTERGEGAVGRAVSEWLFYLSDKFGRDRSLIEEAATGPSSFMHSTEDRLAFLDYLKRNADNTGELLKLERQRQRLNAGREE